MKVLFTSNTSKLSSNQPQMKKDPSGDMLPMLESINFEYVANENINETNLSQSTKNKFKRHFEIDKA